MQVMAAAMLQLAPRGSGRTSFRLYEALQLGLIPVYIWDEDVSGSFIGPRFVWLVASSYYF
jgi:hypothetical protein